MDSRQRSFYQFGRRTLLPLLMERLGGFEVRLRGGENIPPEGEPAILIGNHRTWMDPFFLVLRVERHITFLAADFSFDLPLFGAAYRLAGVESLAVEGGRMAQETLDRAAHLLRRGELIGIYPEGIDNLVDPHPRDPVARFHTGFARIAHRARVPVIPTFIAGSDEYLAREIPPWLVRLFTRSHRLQNGVRMMEYHSPVEVRIGRPLDFSPYYRRRVTKDLLHRMAGEARRAVVHLHRRNVL